MMSHSLRNISTIIISGQNWMITSLFPIFDSCVSWWDRKTRKSLKEPSGKKNFGNQCNVIRWFLQALILFLLLLFIVVIVLKLYKVPIKDGTKNPLISGRISKLETSTEGPCSRKSICSSNHIGFFVQSGAANVVPPKICVNNNLALGTVLNNAGDGINIVVVNGKSGDVLKSDHFNMYSGSVEPLIEFLKNIETGSVVLMAVYDEGSTKLNEEARTLIADLGSSIIHSLGYRDNWVFVGGKGLMGKSNFENYMKSDNSKNKYDSWPEVVEMDGCIPKYVE